MSPNGSTLKSDQPVERDRRREILDLAAGLFATHGVVNTSMQDIARAADLQKPSLYHYFDSKDTILWAVLEEGIKDLVEEANEIATRIDDPLERIRALLSAHVRNLERKRDQVVVFLTHGQDIDPERRERYLRLRREYDDLFVQAIELGQARGHFVDGDPRVIAFGVLGMYNWAVQWYRPDGRLTLDDVHEIFRAFVVRGLTCSEPQQP